MEDLNRAIADETNEAKMRSWARTSVSTKCSTHSSYTPSRSAGVSVSECVARMGKERLILRMRAHCIEHTLAHTRCPCTFRGECDAMNNSRFQFFSLGCCFPLTQSQRTTEQQRSVLRFSLSPLTRACFFLVISFFRIPQFHILRLLYR